MNTLAPLRARWSALQPRQQRVATVALAVLALGLLFAYVWLPLERERAALHKRLPELRQQLATMQQDAEAVKRLRTLPANLNTTPRSIDAAQLRMAFSGAQVTALDAQRFKVIIADTRYAQWLDELRRLGPLVAVDEATLTPTGPGRIGVDATLSVSKS